MSALRSTMAPLIAQTRLLIADPASEQQQYTDQQIQDVLDNWRDDVRYEQLTPAPAIVNIANSTTTPADFIWADYYSLYHWWESDVVIQDGHFIVLTPAATDLIVGHWQFELNVFTSGVVPGQFPPVFATGKIYDLNAAAAELLDYWAATAARSYDFTASGQSFRRSQMQAGLLKQADYYRRKARPKTIRAVRSDLTTVSHAEQVPILGSNRDLVGDS